jgi:hypothetical protein
MEKGRGKWDEVEPPVCSQAGPLLGGWEASRLLLSAWGELGGASPGMETPESQVSEHYLEELGLPME